MEYIRKKELFTSNVIMNSLEKKPTNGGTPAILHSKTVINITKKELYEKLDSEYKLFNSVTIVLKIVQKKTVKDRLYINI